MYKLQNTFITIILCTMSVPIYIFIGSRYCLVIMLFSIYYMILCVHNIILRYTYSIYYIPYIHSAKNLLYRCIRYRRFPRVFLHTLCTDHGACTTIKRPKRVYSLECYYVTQFYFKIFFVFFFFLRIKKRFSTTRE